MLPNAIIIGAQKCATTSLHWYLNEHPDIEAARRKPLGFFVSKENHSIGTLPHTWHRGVDWYAHQCPDRGKVRLESSPDYTNYPHYRGVPERMHSVVPDARLIYIVRNPIERLISHYVHNFAGNIEHQPIEKALAQLEDTPYVSRGRYHMQLEQMLAYFDLSQILIITQEDLLSQRRVTLGRVFRFLDVEEGFWCKEFDTVRHRSAIKRRNNSLGMAIGRFGGNRIFRHLHGRQRYLFNKIVYTPFSSPVVRPGLSASMYARLADIFTHDLERLTSLTGQAFEQLLSATQESVAEIKSVT